MDLGGIECDPIAKNGRSLSFIQWRNALSGRTRPCPRSKQRKKSSVHMHPMDSPASHPRVGTFQWAPRDSEWNRASSELAPLRGGRGTRSKTGTGSIQEYRISFKSRFGASLLRQARCTTRSFLCRQACHKHLQ
jgi:hypothetical protein